MGCWSGSGDMGGRHSSGTSKRRQPSGVQGPTNVNTPEKEKGVKGGCFVCHKVGCHSRNHQSNPKRINRTILENKNTWQELNSSACQLHTDLNNRPTLSYVNVCLRDRPNAEGANARGLQDSGAEVSLIRESYAADLGLQIEPHGTLTVRGIVGDPIKVDAVNLFVQSLDDSDGGITQILFGVSPEINEDLILTVAAVTRL